MNERWKLALLVAVFAVFYFAPLEQAAPVGWLVPGLALLHEYARDHVLTCLVPAFFIAGAVAVFLNKDAVLRYLGPSAKALVSYPLASISGGILAVCSCTVLPLFAGIFKRGAGLGPAVAFVFTGPAINVTAIFLTASVLGWEFASFRLVAAMSIAIVSGLIMSALFEQQTPASSSWAPADGDAEPSYPTSIVGLFLGSQVALLIALGLGDVQITWKVILTIVVIGIILVIAFRHFRKFDREEWIQQTWIFTKQILPFLFIGVFLAGLIAAFLPPEIVGGLVGGNGLGANAIASVSGALMYFATLTEIPILQSLLKLGMGSGPAMALLLTGNALSLPNLIVLNTILGLKRTTVYLGLTVSMSIGAGLGFGMLIA